MLSDLTALLPWRLADRYDVAPVALDGNVLHLTAAHPLDHFAADDLAFSTGCVLVVAVNSAEEVARQRQSVYGRH